MLVASSVLYKELFVGARGVHYLVAHLHFAEECAVEEHPVFVCRFARGFRPAAIPGPEHFHRCPRLRFFTPRAARRRPVSTAEYPLSSAPKSSVIPARRRATVFAFSSRTTSLQPISRKAERISSGFGMRGLSLPTFQSLTSGPTVGSNRPSVRLESSRPWRRTSQKSSETCTAPVPAALFTAEISESALYMLNLFKIVSMREKQAAKVASAAWS